MTDRNATKVTAQPSRRVAFARGIVALRAGNNFDVSCPRTEGESDRAYQTRRFDYVSQEMRKEETNYRS